MKSYFLQTVLFVGSALLRINALGAEAQFVLIAPNVVLANDKMASEVIALTWKKAENVWTPSSSVALSAIALLESPQGEKEILSCGGREIDMSACIKLTRLSRYQVFGLVIGGRKQILLEASPIDPSYDRYLPDLWLTRIVSSQVLDGGPAYWWVLYDVESTRFVDCNRRP